MAKDVTYKGFCQFYFKFVLTYTLMRTTLIVIVGNLILTNNNNQLRVHTRNISYYMNWLEGVKCYFFFFGKHFIWLKRAVCNKIAIIETYKTTHRDFIILPIQNGQVLKSRTIYYFEGLNYMLVSHVSNFCYKPSSLGFSLQYRCFCIILLSRCFDVILVR